MKSFYNKINKGVKGVLLVSILFLTGQLNAQHGWTYNPADFANTGSLATYVLLDGVEVSNGSIGAFVGEECRGYLDNPTFFPPSGHFTFDFVVGSNTSSGEMLSFRYYNPGDGMIYDVTEQIEFIADMISNALLPYELNAITNQAPVVDFPISNQTQDEHFTTLDIDISTVFSDPDGDLLTYSATSSSGSVVNVSVTGTTLTITEVGLGTAIITVTADDGLTTTDDAFDITINNVNDAPVVINALADLGPNEGFGTQDVGIGSVFNDPDGDGMTYSATSSDEGVVTVNVIGTTLTITEVANGVSTITLTASDGTLTGQDVFIVTVNNVNDAPVVSSPIPDQPLLEHFSSTTIDLTSVFTDPDGTVLTLTPVSSNPAVVTVGISDLTLTLSEGSILGSSTISITASDGTLSVVDAFNVTVTNVNDAPIVTGAIPNQSLSEHFVDHDIIITDVFTDPDDDAMTYTAVSSNTDIITVGIAGNTLTLYEVGNGSCSVTLTANDGEFDTNDQFNVTVTNVNDPPEVTNPVADQVIDEHFGTTTIELGSVFTDPDGNPLTLTPSSSNPSVVTVGLSGTTLTITEVGLGTSTITVSASDGSLSVNDIFLVEVVNVNDDPVVDNEIANQNLVEHFGTATVNLSSTFSDPDNDPLTITAVSASPGVVTVSVSGTTLTITEVANGSSIITVTASDGTASVDDVFTVNVANFNDPPTLDNPVADQNLLEHFTSTTIDLSAVFSDPDGDALGLSPVSSNPSAVAVGISGTTLTLIEVGIGSSTITVTASDGTNTVTDNFIVTITNVNDAPTVASSIANIVENEHFTERTIDISGTFSDPDGDALTYAVVSSDEAVVTVAISGNNLVITEAGLGISTITLTASDTEYSANDVFTFQVNNVNDAPVVSNPIPDQPLLEHFTSTDIDLTNVFTDPDGNPLTLSVVSSNTSVVTAAISGSTLTLTEVGNGSSVVTVQANDGVFSANDQFNVTVTNVNDAPVVDNPISNRIYDEGFTTNNINLSSVFSDPDGDVLTLSAVSSLPGVVTVSVTGSTLTITEVANGISTITVTADDGSLTVDETFTVNVNNVNDRPVIVTPVPDQALNEHFESTDIALAGRYSDPDGDALTLTATSGNPAVVTVSVSGTTLTITEVGLGNTNVTVTASDGTLDIDDVFAVAVNNVNDAPVVANPVGNRVYDEHFGSTTISLIGVFTDPDGNSLTLTPVSSDPGVVSVGISGTTLTLTEVGLGVTTITVTANDGSLEVDEVFTVTVNNVNDAPVVDNPIPNQNLNEHFSTENIEIGAVFSDPDGESLTLSAVSGNNAIVTVSITGTTLTITEVGLGSTNITVTASDGTNSTNDVFAVIVNNVNDAPVVASPMDDQSLNEHFGTTTLSLAGVFSDPDADALTLTAVSGSPGVVTVSVSGTTMTITEFGLGTSSITVTASDGSLTVTNLFDITVVNVNDSPVLANSIDDLNLNEHFNVTTRNLAGVFSDPDGDALTLTAVSSNPAIVTVSISGTTLTITEQGIGTSTITVTASDGSLAANDVFNIIVSNVNDAPVVISGIVDQTINEHFTTTTIDMSGVFSDPDGDALVLNPVSNNTAVVNVSMSGSTLTLIEVGLGTATITVTASDGFLTVNDIFTFTVNNVNDAPVVSSPIANRNLDEGFGSTPISLAGVFTDPDGDALTLSAVSGNTDVVTVNVSGTTLTVTEVGLGTAEITLSASDGTLSTDDVFNINVNNVNDAPVVSNAISDQALNEHFGSTPIALAGVFTDPDGDALSLSVVSSNSGVVTAAIAGTTLTLTEVSIGSSTITVTASDGSLSVNDQFNVTITNVNDAPVVVSEITDRSYSEGFTSATISLVPVFSDQDGDALTYSAVSNNSSAVTVGVSASTLTITEVGLGISTITVTASDGTLSVDDVFIVSVDNVNDAPVVSSPVSDQNINEHFTSTTIDLTGVFSDPDGDVLTLTPSSSSPTVVTVGISGTTLTITEVGLGTSTITVNASDGSLSANNAFDFTVNNVNDAPVVAIPITDRSLTEHFSSTTVNLTGVFTDPDSDPLTLTATSSNPLVVTVGITGNTLTITEVGNGSSTITVEASDGALSENDDFIVTVTNVNDAPVVDNPIPDQGLNEHFISTTVDLSLVFSDPDGDALSYAPVSSNPSVVSVGISGTTLTITEVGNGNSTITVTASDGTLSRSDAFIFTVTNVNDAPVVANPFADQVLNEHFTSTTRNISGVFTDPDGDDLTLSAVSGNTSVVDVSVSGTTLTITEVGLGSSTITLTANDGALSKDNEFLITVNNVNDAPVVSSAISNQGLSEHFSSTTIPLGSVFTDPDGDALTLSAVSSNTAVVTVGVAGSTLTITEAGLGSSTITVTASDGALSADNQFLVTVTNVNDAPVEVSPIVDRSLNEHFGSTLIDISGVFTDPDGDAIVITALSSDGGVVTVNVAGSNLAVSEVGLGTSTITLTASDGSLTGTSQFDITVNNLNDAPVIVSPLSSVSYNEGFSSMVIDLTPVFSDPDGDGMTYSASSSNNGVVTVSVSGSNLTIFEGSLGSSTITVTASDGTLSTDDQFTVLVNNVNDQPEVVVPIADRNYDEGFSATTINLSSNFSDPDGDVLTLSVVNSNPAAISVSISGSTLTVTEVGLGTSSVTVTASDGSLSVDDVFTINVNNVNDQPVVDNPIPNQDLLQYFANTSIGLSSVFSDPDGDFLTLSAVSSNAGVVTVVVSGTTLYINEVGLGTSTITVTASDGTLSINDQFTVNVGNVNDRPVVIGPVPNRVYTEGFFSASLSLAAVFSDPDGDVLTLTPVSSDESVVTVSISGTILTINEVGLGTSTITVTASDGSLDIDDDFLVTVTNINDPPQVTSPAPDLTLNEHFSSQNVDLSSVFTDPDGDLLSFSPVSSNTAAVSVSVSGSTLVITEEGLGFSIISVTASDGSLTAIDAFTVMVNNVNDAPVLVGTLNDRTLNEYFTALPIPLVGVFDDPDGDALIYTAVSSDPAVIGANVSGTTLTITEFGLGTSTVTVTASDGALSANVQFLVTVNNVNDAPVVANPVTDRALNEHFGSTTINLAGVFTDKDADPLTLTPASSDESVVTVSITGTVLTITEVGLGTSTITVNAFDGQYGINDDFDVTVNNVNDPPFVDNGVADLPLLEHFNTTTVNLSSVFDDPDADVLTISAVSSNPAVVSVNVSGTTLTITEESLGSANIVLTATDGEFNVIDQFTVTVANVNDAPVIDNPIADLPLSEHFGSTTVNLAGVFSDPDGDGIDLSYSNSNNSVVTVGISGTTLNITGVGLGSTTVTITASDGSLSVDDQFVITVVNENDPPEVISHILSQLVYEHFGSTTIDVSGVFNEPDGDPLTISAVSSNEGVVTVSMSGTTLTLTEVGLGTSNITLSAFDGVFTVDDQFTVNVINVNDPPEVAAPIPDQPLNEYFSSLSISLSGVFTDPDGDALAITAVSSNTDVVTVAISGGFVVLTEVGLGTASISVTANDGALEETDDFVVTVGNVNDQPVVDNPIADQNLYEHFSSHEIEIANVFSDKDGTALLYSVVSSNTAVVTVGISGTTLIITEVGLGTSTVTVSASDGSLSTNDAFVVVVNNVNDAPVVENPLTDRSIDEQFGVTTIDLSGVFSDPDGDVLTLTALSNNLGVATVSVDAFSLLITEAGQGSTDITITASDGTLTANTQFTVTIDDVNFAPEVILPVEDMDLYEHFADSIIDLSLVYYDMDGDPLTFAAGTNNAEVVSVSISGSMLTITEVGLGDAVITVHAGDGEFITDDDFNVTVHNVNDAPFLIESVGDIELVKDFISFEYKLHEIFGDPDADTLTFTVIAETADIVSITLSDSTVVLSGIGLGSTEVVFTASDTGLNVTDTILITVVEEVDLLIYFDDKQKLDLDTIYICNPPGEIDIDVKTEVTWSFVNNNNWIAIDVKNDSTMTIGYTRNLFDFDRIGTVTIIDEQGHEIDVVVKQTENCHVGIENGIYSGFSIYPNPVTETLFITLENIDGNKIMLDLIDSNGKLLTKDVREVSYNDKLMLDMSQYEQGIYFIRISDDSRSYIKQIIKR